MFIFTIQGSRDLISQYDIASLKKLLQHYRYNKFIKHRNGASYLLYVFEGPRTQAFFLGRDRLGAVLMFSKKKELFYWIYIIAIVTFTRVSFRDELFTEIDLKTLSVNSRVDRRCRCRRQNEIISCWR